MHKKLEFTTNNRNLLTISWANVALERQGVSWILAYAYNIMIVEYEYSGQYTNFENENW